MNSVRIIGGQIRRRVLEFPDSVGMRPTPDRVRETLFNWLMPKPPGARVLDLFAGSGGLGLEAVARGAAAAPQVGGRVRRGVGQRGSSRNPVTSQHAAVCNSFKKEGRPARR